MNNYLPMIGSLIAFKQIEYTSASFVQSFLDSKWVGWANFDYLFSTSDAWTITRNTLFYNAVFIILNLVIGVSLALLFNAMRNRRLAKFHQTTMFLPYFLSMVVISYLVYAFLN